MPPRRLLVGQEAEVAGAYRAGATILALAERYECSAASIRAVLEDQGVDMRTRGPRSPLAGREDEVAAAYREGATIRELAARFGANARTVSKVLADRGVGARRPGRKPG